MSQLRQGIHLNRIAFVVVNVCLYFLLDYIFGIPSTVIKAFGFLAGLCLLSVINALVIGSRNTLFGNSAEAFAFILYLVVLGISVSLGTVVAMVLGHISATVTILAIVILLESALASFVLFD